MTKRMITKVKDISLVVDNVSLFKQRDLMSSEWHVLVGNAPYVTVVNK